jgi:hypothetical protein
MASAERSSCEGELNVPMTLDHLSAFSGLKVVAPNLRSAAKKFRGSSMQGGVGQGTNATMESSGLSCLRSEPGLVGGVPDFPAVTPTIEPLSSSALPS